MNNDDNGYQSTKNSFSKSDKNNTSQIEAFNTGNKNIKDKL